MSYLDQRVFAILRSSSRECLAAVVETLVDGGLRSIEVTMTTPGALDAITAARAAYPEVFVGAGTVMDAADANAAIDAGAQFCVAPILDASMITACVARGVASVPGVATPTEMVNAVRLGADACKLFPSRPDGVAFVKSVLVPLPHLKIIPTGGVQIDDMRAYLDAGCAAVGLGSPLIGDALSGGSLDALRDRVKRVLEAAS